MENGLLTTIKNSCNFIYIISGGGFYNEKGHKIGKWIE